MSFLMKRTFGVLSVFVLLAPVAVHAQAPSGILQQIEQIQERVQGLQDRFGQGRSNADSATSTTGDRSSQAGLPTLPEQASDRAKEVMQCLQLGRSMGIGSQGVDVENVQSFLKEQGYFDYAEATGYFGPITQEAVQEFQQARGIVANGSPETTGFGLVGPRTRAALAQASCLSGGESADADDEEEQDDEDDETEEEESEDEEETEEEDESDEDGSNE